MLSLITAESQKQYWEVKKQYRDVIIFFKVGKFYELYEGLLSPTPLKSPTPVSYGAPRPLVHPAEDAQIGHDTFGWKMTLTGVGHCRQVTPLP